MNLSKKAELTLIKIIGLIILGLVLVFILPFILNLGENTKSGLDSVNLEADIQSCEIGLCQITNCEPNVNLDCSDNEKVRWESLKNYANTCKNKDGSKCDNALINAIKTAKDNSISINDNNLDNSNLISNEKILSFKNSDFYKNYKTKFELYAKKNNFDVNILYAILINEGSYSNSFEKNVRFECSKFNKAISWYQSKVSCTINNGKSFSQITSETNYKAYLNAKKIDPKIAFRSTSFGFGQIMGFNIMGYGISINFEGNLDEVRNMNNQILFFLKFLENNNLIKNFQNKNWNEIAKKYNGVGYAQNNYNNKLKNNYKVLIS